MNEKEIEDEILEFARKKFPDMIFHRASITLTLGYLAENNLKVVEEPKETNVSN